MATLSDEQLRALRFLARHPGGFTEAMLLRQGFTAVQLSPLVYAGTCQVTRNRPLEGVPSENHRGGTEGDRC